MHRSLIRPDAQGFVDFQNGNLTAFLIGIGLGMPENDIYGFVRLGIVDKQFEFDPFLERSGSRFLSRKQPFVTIAVAVHNLNYR